MLQTQAPVKLVLIPKENVDQVWNLCEDFIDAGCSYGESLPETLKADAAKGDAQLWFAWSDRLEAALICRIIQKADGTGNVCNLDSFGARRFDTVRHLIPELRDLVGCPLRIYGRMGWARTMKDLFEVKWVCMDTKV